MGRSPVRGLSLADVRQAQSRIEGVVQRTPLVHSPELSRIHGAPVYLKLENQQITGSFKLRGALNAVLALPEEERRRGVVTVSTGNHGRAVAFACWRSGARAVVCVSRLVPGNKLAAIEELGAEVRIVGSSQDEAQLEAERLVAEEGLALIPPFDHPEVIAGQGTLGLEIGEQWAENRGREQQGGDQAHPGGMLRVLVPVSGGGLIAGVALALKSMALKSTALKSVPSQSEALKSMALNSLPQSEPPVQVHITGVSMERGCAMFQSLQAGKPIEVEEPESLADSLGGGIGLANRYTFDLVRDLVDEHLLVSEDLLPRAIAHAHRFEGQVVEGAGAVGIAALLAEFESERSERSSAERSLPTKAAAERAASEKAVATVVLLSGGNIDGEVHARLTASAAGSAGGSTGIAGRAPVRAEVPSPEAADAGEGVRSTTTVEGRQGGE